MKSHLLLMRALGCVVLFAATGQGALISVTDAFGNPTISVVEGTPSVDVYVRIAQDGADGPNNTISDMGLRFIVGDGGPELGQSDIVPITNVSVVGTGAGANASIWDPQSGSLTTSVLPGPLPLSSAAIINAAILSANTTVQYGPGVTGTVLAVVTLNTSGLTAGQTDSLGTLGGFLLNPTLTGNPTIASFANAIGPGTNPIPLSFNAGLLSVTAIPEPGSFLLLSLGATAVFARRRRRAKAMKQDATAA